MGGLQPRFPCPHRLWALRNYVQEASRTAVSRLYEAWGHHKATWYNTLAMVRLATHTEQIWEPANRDWLQATLIFPHNACCWARWQDAMATRPSREVNSMLRAADAVFEEIGQSMVEFVHRALYHTDVLEQEPPTSSDLALPLSMVHDHPATWCRAAANFAAEHRRGDCGGCDRGAFLRDRNESYGTLLRFFGPLPLLEWLDGAHPAVRAAILDAGDF